MADLEGISSSLIASDGDTTDGGDTDGTSEENDLTDLLD